MSLNVEAILELIEHKFRNNKTAFAEEIGVNASYLNQILNYKIKQESPKVCSGILNYCKKNNLDYNKYIFLN